MPLKDFQCKNCNAEFEELINLSEASIPCPQCKTETIPNNFCIQQTGEHSPHYRDMHQKAVNMKKKMTGQQNWRKYSESQSD